MIDFDALAREIHNDNKAVGWWDDPDRCILTCIQLCITEVAKATEGERKNLMDDKLPHRKMGEVELADTLIRVLDLGGRFELEYDPDTAAEIPLPLEKTDPDLSIGAQHFYLSQALVFMGSDYLSEVKPRNRYGFFENSYSEVIAIILNIAERNGYDIIGAMQEKREFNRTREDHKRENRAKEGGKAF